MHKASQSMTSCASGLSGRNAKWMAVSTSQQIASGTNSGHSQKTFQSSIAATATTRARTRRRNGKSTHPNANGSNAKVITCIIWLPATLGWKIH